MIMTSSDEKRNYDKVSLSADVVESHLPAILIEGAHSIHYRIVHAAELFL